jgi:hypothetical protein
MSKDIVKIEKAGDVVTLLDQTFNGLVAVLAGIASSDKKDWALSIGYILQRSRGANFLNALIEEMRKYREKGEIKDDYFQTNQGLDCLQEILDFIDKDSPDDIRFKAMKTVFLNIATEKHSGREDALPVQIMKICRSLSSVEILILAASYKMLTSGESKKDERKASNLGDYGGGAFWVDYVAKESGLRFPELIKSHEKQLVDKNLISSPFDGSGNLFPRGEFYRLTSLGHHVCAFIGDYAPKN